MVTGTELTTAVIAANIPKEVWNKFYEDFLSPTVKYAGEIGLVAAEAATFFFNPALHAIIDNRRNLVRDLTAVCESVPPERRVPAAPEIAGPVFEKLRYLDDSNKLKDLYLNLLKAAIDSERKDGVHPGFLKVLESLAAEDALLFWYMIKWSKIERTIRLLLPSGYPDIHNDVEAVTIRTLNNVGTVIEPLKNLSSARLRTSMELLYSLALISHSGGSSVGSDQIEYDCDITNFGKQFAAVCLPDVFEPSAGSHEK